MGSSARPGDAPQARLWRVVDSGPQVGSTPPGGTAPPQAGAGDADVAASRARLAAAAGSCMGTAPAGATTAVRPVRWRVSPRLAGTVAVALSVLVGGVALRAAARPDGVPPVELPTPAVAAAEPTATAGGGATAAGTPGAVVLVHVVGRVAAPGVVRLPAGARVVDAVWAAGGPLPDAELAAVNLARVVGDGEQVLVPAVGDPAPAAAGGVAGAAGRSSDARVDLNTADAAALDALPGIGPVLADRILAWRQEHGRFTDVEELTEVSGIGPAVLDRLRDLVRV